MKKKELKKQEHISMEKFLRHYLKINNDCLIKDLKKLSHQDLKEVYENLYGIELICAPFENVNLEDLLCGKIILVSDKKGCLSPYINPIQIDFNSIIKENKKRKKQNSIQTYDEYIDVLDEIALDKNIKNNQIKVLSYRRNTSRREEE